MSGKGAGKKRNRAAQSDQHGYQERPGEKAGKQGAGDSGSADRNSRQVEKQRVIDKLRDLQKRRQKKSGD